MKTTPNTRKNSKEESALVLRDDTNTIDCMSPKKITEEVLAVEADPEAEPPVEGVDAVPYSAAVLWKIQGTKDWQNVVSASGEVSLVCTHTYNIPQ